MFPHPAINDISSRELVVLAAELALNLACTELKDIISRRWLTGFFADKRSQMHCVATLWVNGSYLTAERINIAI